ncbi:MAG: serine hydrolase [Terriglobales bacterium]
MTRTCAASPSARRGFGAIVCTSLLFCCASSAAVVPRADHLNRQLRDIAAQFSGHVALAGADLTTGQRFGLHPNRAVATASVIKLPVMVTAFYEMRAGQLHWNQVLPMTAWDQVPGSGILQSFALTPPPQLTLGDAITLMIDLSDNTAANMVIRAVGIPAVNARMRRLGLPHTILYAYVFHASHPRLAGERKFGLGETTPAEMVRLLTLIVQHRILTPQACEQMLKILGQQEDNEAFPRYMAAFPRVTWAHKTGALNAVRNDVGVATTPVGPIVLAGFAYGSKDQQWTAENPALLVLGHLAQAVIVHFVTSVTSGP